VLDAKAWALSDRDLLIEVSDRDLGARSFWTFSDVISSLGPLLPPCSVDIVKVRARFFAIPASSVPTSDPAVLPEDGVFLSPCNVGIVKVSARFFSGSFLFSCSPSPSDMEPFCKKRPLLAAERAKFPFA
jgi:hypothetical protein